MPTSRRVLLTILAMTMSQPATKAAAQSSLCSLYTAAEVGKLLGTAVENGDPLAPGTGCQWFGKDEVSYVVVQITDTSFWLDPRQAPGYRTIPGLGKRAYSHPDAEGGWRAMALTDRGSSAVLMIGSSATRDATESILRKLTNR